MLLVVTAIALALITQFVVDWAKTYEWWPGVTEEIKEV